jgi:GMP synthase (glutamine-hydrolysing)
MTVFLVLRHGDDIPLGYLGDALDEAGVDRHEVLLHRGDEPPPGRDWKAVVVLGGSMGVYDEERYGWLRREKAFVGDAASRGIPILGICLGSQLLAEVLGARAYLAEDGPEIGHIQPSLTDAGSADPVLRHLDVPVPVWHRDTWDVPPGATLLAKSERFPHAFRRGKVVAIQAHPEADTEIVAAWTMHDGAATDLARAGLAEEDLLVAIENGADGQRDAASRLFGAWVAEAVG